LRLNDIDNQSFTRAQVNSPRHSLIAINKEEGASPLMSKRIPILAAALLIISSALLVAAQTTTTTVTQTPTTVTKTVQNPDGSYTIIEYPVGKEVQLAFTPVSLTNSKAVGTILRDDNGTRVILNVTDVPADVSAINVYAVDDAGVVTLLGPVVVSNGTGKFTATTPLSKFMLIAAPDASLTAYDPNAKIYFRSAVPEGFAVIPHTTAAAGPTIVTTTPATATTPTIVTTTPATVTPTIVTTTPATVTPTIVTTTPATVTPTIVTTTPATVSTPTIVTTPTVAANPTIVTTTPTTVTKTVQNADGSYTIIEYPVGKEVPLTFTPVSLTGSKAVGTILRDDSGTKVILNVTDVPADVSAINVYAVDDTGGVTLLGPVVITNGTGKFTGTTPLSKFMLIAAPDASLTAYDPNARIYFRSAVPEGFAVIPFTTSPVGETVSATTTPGTTPAAASISAVPMLNIPAYKKGDDTKLKIDFTGAMSGARANVFIEPHKNGKETQVKMVFHELKEAPTGQTYILWAVSPDNQFFKLGQIANFKGRNEAEIKANTSLDDFGLLVTMEDFGALKTIVVPAGPRLGIIQLTP
jgi:hypothetical protein